MQKKKKHFALISTLVLGSVTSFSFTLSSCSTVYPKINWIGEKNFNIIGSDDTNTIEFFGYFKDDLKNPTITYLDANGNSLNSEDERYSIIKNTIDVEFVSLHNSGNVTICYNHKTAPSKEECEIINGCKIRSTFNFNHHNLSYIFDKKIIFQTSPIMNLELQLDTSANPGNYLRSIPNETDFANAEIDALQPYRNGCFFNDIPRVDGTPVYFGYSTPTVPQTDPGYDEMLLRYVDITNMLKADMAYFTQIMQKSVENYASQFTGKITSFNANINLDYDMEHANITKFSMSANANLKIAGLLNGTVKLKANLFSPYHLFGTFLTDFNDLPTFFSQLVPTLADGGNNDKEGLYDVSFEGNMPAYTYSYDEYGSYVGDEIFGDLSEEHELGFYLPCYWLSDGGKIDSLVLEEGQFTAQKQFELINSSQGLNSDNFLNIGLFKDKGKTNLGDRFYGTSYFLQDSSHISDNNTFVVGVKDSPKTYTLPWYEVMSFYRDKSQPNNINYVANDDGTYHIEYFLNNCFSDNVDWFPRIIPSDSIKCN